MSKINNEAVNNEAREAEVFGLMSIADTKLYAPSQSLVNAERDILVAGKSFTEVREAAQRKQCLVVYEVARSEAYKDAYKSLADYLTALALPTMIGKNGSVSSSLASQIKAAGSVYADANAPEALKALTWSILGALGGILNNADKRKVLFSEVAEGKVSITNMAEAKAYAKSVNHPEAVKNEAEDEDKTEGKTKGKDKSEAVKLYTITKRGTPVGVTIEHEDERTVAHIGLTTDEVIKAVREDSGTPLAHWGDMSCVIAYDPTNERAEAYTAHEYTGAADIQLPSVEAVAKMRELASLMDIGEQARVVLTLCDTLGYGYAE